MATASNENYIESNPMRPVNEAVQEYRVREDGALAQYLQEREIEYHLALNVEQRRTVMEDIKAAKMLQDEEDKKAKILTIDEQEELKTHDERIAEEMQADLLQKEVELRELEEHDSEIAQKMIERDKERDDRQLSHDRRLAEKIDGMKLKEERRKELSDEDLAWKLQEEERRKLKHRKESRNHINTVIEMQDEELARFIHEKEEAEVMRRKEHEERKRRKRLKHPEHYSHPDLLEHVDAEIPHTSHQQPGPSKSRASKKEGRSHDEPPPRSSQLHRREDLSSAHVEEKKHRSKEKSSSHGHGESHSRRNSEKPHRPPPPSERSSRSTTKHRSRSKSKENLTQNVNGTPHRGSRTDRHAASRERRRSEETDDPWQRFPQSSSTHPPKSSPMEENIPYGEGFARLAEQEEWNRNPREDRKKRNKNDCKQQ